MPERRTRSRAAAPRRSIGIGIGELRRAVGVLDQTTQQNAAASTGRGVRLAEVVGRFRWQLA